jgi:hypothetical protein
MSFSLAENIFTLHFRHFCPQCRSPLTCSIFHGLLDKYGPLNSLVVRVTAGRHFAKELAGRDGGREKY